MDQEIFSRIMDYVGEEGRVINLITLKGPTGFIKVIKDKNRLRSTNRCDTLEEVLGEDEINNINEPDIVAAFSVYDRWINQEKGVREKLRDISRTSSYSLSIIHAYLQKDEFDNHEFWRWYELTRGNKPVTIKKYISAFRDTWKKMETCQFNVLSLSDSNDLDFILNNAKFIAVDKRGNGMYSSPINTLKEFLETDKNNEELYQDFLNMNSDHGNHDENEEDKIVSKKAPTIESGRITYPRNQVIARKEMIRQKFLCEVNPDHRSFISKGSSRYFMEAHHLIQLNSQNKFDNSLDVGGNIVSLCPNCHRQVHHGQDEEVKTILKILYEKRKERLTNCGLTIEVDELYKLYKL